MHILHFEKFCQIVLQYGNTNGSNYFPIISLIFHCCFIFAFSLVLARLSTFAWFFLAMYISLTDCLFMPFAYLLDCLFCYQFIRMLKKMFLMSSCTHHQGLILLTHGQYILPSTCTTHMDCFEANPQYHTISFLSKAKRSKLLKISKSYPKRKIISLISLTIQCSHFLH